MAEKDIKKTPAATQTVQPSADKYTIQELENASTKVFGVVQLERQSSQQNIQVVQNSQQQSERSLAIPQRKSASYIWMALSSKK